MPPASTRSPVASHFMRARRASRARASASSRIEASTQFGDGARSGHRPRISSRCAADLLGRAAAGAGVALVLVAVHGVLDLVLGGAQVLLGHRLQVLGARELAVAVLVGFLELLGKRRVAFRLGARDVAVLVLVERVEAGVILVLADLVIGIGGADSERERRGHQEEKRLSESHGILGRNLDGRDYASAAAARQSAVGT